MLVEMMTFRMPVPAGWKICNCSSVLRPAWRGRSFSCDAFEGSLARYQRWRTACRINERGKKILQFLETSFNVFSPGQKYKNVARALLPFRQSMKESQFARTYFQINVPSNFSCLLNIIMRWFLEICNLNRIHTSFQANNSCSMGYTIGEVIKKLCGIQCGWRHDNSKGRSFSHYSGWRAWAD